MSKKIKKIVKLTFPEKLIKEPITFKMAKKYDIIPNIRRAKVTETVGELVLELIGEEKKVNLALKFLDRKGVIVEPIEGDIVQ